MSYLRAAYREHTGIIVPHNWEWASRAAPIILDWVSHYHYLLLHYQYFLSHYLQHSASHCTLFFIPLSLPIITYYHLIITYHHLLSHYYCISSHYHYFLSHCHCFYHIIITYHHIIINSYHIISNTQLLTVHYFALNVPSHFLICLWPSHSSPLLITHFYPSLSPSYLLYAFSLISLFILAVLHMLILIISADLRGVTCYIKERQHCSPCELPLCVSQYF